MQLAFGSFRLDCPWSIFIILSVVLSCDAYVPSQGEMLRIIIILASVIVMSGSCLWAPTLMLSTVMLSTPVLSILMLSTPMLSMCAPCRAWTLWSSDPLCLSPVHHRKLCDGGQGQGSAGEGFPLGLSWDFHCDQVVLCEYITVFIRVWLRGMCIC